LKKTDELQKKAKLE
jgi:hypothetical protein